MGHKSHCRPWRWTQGLTRRPRSRGISWVCHCLYPSQTDGQDVWRTMEGVRRWVQPSKHDHINWLDGFQLGGFAQSIWQREGGLCWGFQGYISYCHGSNRNSNWFFLLLGLVRGVYYRSWIIRVKSPHPDKELDSLLGWLLPSCCHAMLDLV